MDSFLEGWLACPRCGGDLVAAADGGVCQSCGTAYGARGATLDLVDPAVKVSSEGPGDTAAMAWRRRRWDELRGPAAPENAAYLSAIWERIRPDDQVVDLGCGPGTLLGWLADFAPELALLGLDISWDALEEARRVQEAHPNVAVARASTRRRLPVKDASCDLVLRRLAPALPEEIVRVLAPGGHYVRFTFGAEHWREVYDALPHLPRAREDTLLGEREHLAQLGLDVAEPIRHQGREAFTLPAVMLALRSNPAAFHAQHLDDSALRALWHMGDGGRRQRLELTTDYVLLVARRPAEARIAVSAPTTPAPEPEVPTEPAPETAQPAESAEPAAAIAPEAEPAPPPAAETIAKPKRTRKKAAPAETAEAPAEPEPPRSPEPSAPTDTAEEPAGAVPSEPVEPADAAEAAPKRRRRATASAPSDESPPPQKRPRRPRSSAQPPPEDRSPDDAEPSD